MTIQNTGRGYHTFFDDPDVIAKASRGLGEAMVGINVEEVPHRTASPRRLVNGAPA